MGALDEQIPGRHGMVRRHGGALPVSPPRLRRRQSAPDPWRWWRLHAASTRTSACRSPGSRSCACAARFRTPAEAAAAVAGERRWVCDPRGTFCEVGDRRSLRPERGSTCSPPSPGAATTAHGAAASRLRGAEPRDRSRHGRQRIPGLAAPGHGEAARAVGGGLGVRLTRGRAVPPRPPRAPGPGAHLADTAAPGTMGRPAARVRRRSRREFSRREPGPPPGGLSTSAGGSPRGSPRACAARRPPSGTGRCSTCAPGCRSRTRAALLAGHFPYRTRCAPPAPAGRERGVHRAVLRGVVDRQDRVALRVGAHAPGLVRADPVGLGDRSPRIECAGDPCSHDMSSVASGRLGRGATGGRC